jgi:hypothetical protein
MVSSGYMNIVYMNEAVVDCRLRGIYRQLKRNAYNKAMNNVISIISDFRKADIDMDKNLAEHVMTELLRIRIAMAFKRYQDAHNRVRDLHYKLLYV